MIEFAQSFGHTMIGTKFAHYEITSHLGSGGMGDVYQATDSKLGRSVAIKFLPEALTHDGERVMRFQREARVLASLNHSNIAAIHGLEEISGRHFLVMELVPGETLAGRIKRGVIPVDEALGIARQITEALEAAHEAGVIHRDLKPANVKVTPDGKVKVLDFGLAKVFEPGPPLPEDGPDEGLSNSPTLNGTTTPGVILGTAAYMSPEQATGLMVDHRTDMFAFGCILYEMLVGRQVFRGETVTDILTSVLTAEPDWSRLPEDTPPPIRRLLRRCLQKDRNRRLRTAADARIEIDEAGMEQEQPEEAIGARLQSSRRKRNWLAWTIVGLLFGTTAVLGLLYFRAPAEAAEMRVAISTPLTPGLISALASFALSPDGHQLVFVAAGDGQPRLWLRPLDKLAAQPLPGTEDASFPFWSPDNRSVGFFADGKLKRIDIGGGQLQTLAAAGTARGGTWSSDDVILFAPTSGGPLTRVSASGGDAVVQTRLESAGHSAHKFPYFLPDGRQFLFYANGKTEDVRGIYRGSLDSQDTKRVTAADSAGVYLPPGWLLFVRQGSLVARHFDLSSGEISGDPVVIADSVAFEGNLQFGAFAVSATGLVVYRVAGSTQQQLTWFDRSGKALGSVGAPDENALFDPVLSPDGRRVAVRRTVQGNTDVWLLDEHTSPFTFDTSVDQFPVWSPDGRRIVFSSNRKGVPDLYVKASSGSGNEELLRDSPYAKVGYDWSRDGRFLLLVGGDNQSTAPDLAILSMVGDKKWRVFLNSKFSERAGQFSPDTKWVAYQSNESQRYEIYIVPFPDPSGGKWPVSTAGGVAPRWSPDGNELYYIAPDGKLMAASVAVKGGVLKIGTPVPLFQTRIVGGGFSPTNLRHQYDVAPDGRFLINVATQDSVTPPITLLLNWKPPAK